METQDKHLDGDTLCDYAEGALDARAQALAEAHLQACPQCLNELKLARGYFRELTALEPVQAPANFLANVRARLPQPSPWKKFLSACMRPMRAVPTQIAFLSVLGLTVITAYLYEKGSLVPETTSVIAYPQAEAERDSRSAPAPAALAAPALPAKEANKPLAAKQEEKSDDGRDEDQKTKRNMLARLSKQASQAPEPTAPRTPIALQPMPPHRLIGSVAPSKAYRVQPKQSASGYADQANSGQRQDREALEMQSPQAVAKSEAAPSKVAFSDSPPAGEKDLAGRDQSGRATGALDKAEAAAPPAEAIPDLTVSLRQAGDVSALLAGLKAMGAEVRPQPPQPDGGPSAYQLRIPASMVPAVKPYLERYGKLVLGGGPMPAHPAGPVSIRLRVDSPAE